MGDLLGVRGHLLPQDKMWLALSIIGVAFAITILAWIALKIRSLFLPFGEGNSWDLSTNPPWFTWDRLPAVCGGV